MELIIDTSSKKMKLLLTDGGNVHSGTEYDSNHSEHLLKEIEQLLETSGKKLKDISIVSLVIGPGSFTGIRLSVATAKALSVVFNKIKFIEINKLDLLNAKLSIKQQFSNYLIALYCTSSKSYVLVKIDNKIEYKTMLNDDIETLSRKEHLKIYCFDKLSLNALDCEEIFLSDQDYIKFVDNKKKENCFVDAKNIEPLYMAISQAEEELLKKKQNV